MSANNNWFLALALASSLTLSACGGSSSGSDPVVPPPEQTPDPTPAPTAETVTVTGFVTDMPIPNATVVITVDGQQFTAPNPTAADGSFSVDVESTNPDAMVICEAFDPTGPVRFSALLNDFAGLQDDAGDDGVAESVNITNVTTAQFLLAQELAVDGTIDDIEELQAISEQINPEELLELSAAIKVVVDSISGVVLPDGFNDVQELAQAIVDDTTDFVETIEVLNPGILAQTVEAVVSDGFATVAFEEAAVAGVYVESSGEDLVVLFADGTGYSAEEDSFVAADGTQFEGQVIEELSWSVNEDGILQIVYLETQDMDAVTLLNDASGVLTISVNELAGDTGESERNTFNVMRFSFSDEGFDAASVPGSYNDPEDEDEETEFTVFLADGSGYDIDVATGSQDDFFTWEINATGELLMTDDGVINADDRELDDDRSRVWLLEGSTPERPLLFVMELELEGDGVTGLEAFPVTYTAEIFTGPSPDMANMMLLEGKSYGFTDGDESGLVTFGENGVWREITQGFDDQDGPEWEEAEGEWFVDADGVLYITVVEADGTAEVDTATVLSGLGEDRMVVMVDNDESVSEIGLDRVVPFTADELVGTWQEVVSNSSSEYTATFNADGSGFYMENGQIDDQFEWMIDANGVLVVSFFEEAGVADVFTDNFHKLADSTANTVNAMLVLRLNGEVVNDALDPEGAPQAVFKVQLQKLSN